jgi:RIO kinase 2
MEAVKDDSPEGSDDSEEDEEEEDQSEVRAELQSSENAQLSPACDDTTADYTVSPGEELAADGGISPPRELSRSPPRSRSPSPSSLAKMTAALSISSQHQDIKDIVSSDLTKERARQRQKYHSKRGAHRIGRPKGSKAKQDSRVKVDKSGFWE